VTVREATGNSVAPTLDLERRDTGFGRRGKTYALTVSPHEPIELIHTAHRMRF